MRNERPLSYFVSGFFKDELQVARGVSPHTYRAYGTTLRFFIAYLEVQLNKKFREIKADELTYTHIRDWMITDKKKRQWSENTWNRHLATIKSFARFLSYLDIRYVNLAERVSLLRSQRVPKNHPDYITPSELKTLLEENISGNGTVFRDRLILQLLFFSGMRVEELTSERVHDLIWSSSNILSFNIRGKGNKARTVLVKEQATISNLKAYIQKQSRYGLKSEYLFAGRDGKRMSEGNIRRLVKKFDAKLQGKSISPHSMRHSAAMNWLENGMELNRLSDLLGHEQTTTTYKTYLRSTMKMKIEALDAAGQDKTLSQIFRTNEATDEDFWESIGVVAQNLQ